MKSIEIKNFSKVYKKSIKAVDNLSLDIPRGCFFGLLGPNGAGKTTTVNFVAGLIRRSSGELFIQEETITDSSYMYKGKIGFVLDRPLYIEKFTAKEYLSFAGQMYGLDSSASNRRSDELLEFMDLGEKHNELIETYSAGMKKKVSLSAALIHNPEILILDEPFEGIDPVSSKKIREVLLDLVKKGKTIVLTSHILEIVEKLCDEVAIMNKGKLIFQNRIENIQTYIKEGKEQTHYQGLEELFYHLVSQNDLPSTLSWL